ncbi:MAG: B12-binding domain-containing radical SAM protein, partial [Asgard group archaeon]|nr:B12-binding domain-containing radical SAM protein [Asgard group archaeon]
MKILLICPESRKKGLGNELRFTSMPVYKLLVNSFFKPNLTVLTLAALTPKEHIVRIIDDTVEIINFDEEYDLVGITIMTTTANRGYEIADEFRRRSIPVVIGGWHASVLPEEAKQHAESVVIGEAENLWPELLNDFSKAKLKPFYKQTEKVDLGLVPPITDIRKSIKYGSFPDGIEATRGCSVGCKFCCTTNKPLYREFRTRPINNIIKEINYLPRKFFVFIDSSLMFNPSFSKQLFRELKNFNKKFYMLGNIHDFEKDDELLKLAADAGLMQINLGLESPDQIAIDSIGKKTNKVKEYAAIISKIHDYGIGVLGYFMFGFDTDTMKTFDKTQNFANDIKLDLTNFMILTPYPGTPVYSQLESEGRIITKDWSKYDLDTVVFKPKNMTPEELLSETKRIAKEYYSSINVMKRILRST